MTRERGRFAAGLLAGCLLAVVIAAVSQTTMKRALVAAAAGLFVLGLAVVKQRDRICLGLMIFAIPLNINYYLFHLYSFHIGGAIGLYLLPLDLPLLWLLGSWFMDWVMGAPSMVRIPRLAQFFIPFFLVEAVSMLYAIDPSWAAYELVRWIRFLLIIVYVASRVRPREVRFCLGALAGAAVFQACLAMAQTTFRSNFGMDRLGIVGKGSENVFAEQVGGTDIVRGAGTVGHPNGLAPLLLLTVFVFILLALSRAVRGQRLRWAFTSVLVTGGIVVTLSRAAWLSYVLAAGMMLTVAVLVQLVPARRALMTAFCSVVIVCAVALPFSSKLAARWSGRLDEAIEMRAKLARSALEIVRDHPLGGVGLNNFTIAYRNYDRATAEMFEKEWGTVPVVHNIFLLVWGETGTIGLLAYLGFWIFSFVWSMRYLRRLGGLGRCVAIGAWCGVTAVLISDFTSFGFWTEPVMYTAAVLFGLFEPLQFASPAAAARASSLAVLPAFDSPAPHTPQVTVPTL